jgi:hypothetical protein
MPKTKMVKITKDDQEAEVLKSAVRAWERNGWTVVDDGDSEDAPVAATGDPSQGEQVSPTDGVDNDNHSVTLTETKE